MEISVPKENKKFVQKVMNPFTGIYVDVHEPDWAFETLSKDKGILVKRKNLGSRKSGSPGAGDYAFGNIGIERKSFKDYMNSLSSGRLWKQMRKMKEGYERPLLVIEDLKDPTVQLIGIQNIRFTSSLARIVLMGINVVTLPTHAHFCSFVQYLYFSSGKAPSKFKTLPKKSVSKNAIKRDMISMVPGIGGKTANAILARYSTLPELIGANLNDLIQNTPLGPKKAKILWEILHT